MQWVLFTLLLKLLNGKKKSSILWTSDQLKPNYSFWSCKYEFRWSTQTQHDGCCSADQKGLILKNTKINLKSFFIIKKVPLLVL